MSYALRCLRRRAVCEEENEDIATTIATVLNNKLLLVDVDVVLARLEPASSPSAQRPVGIATIGGGGNNIIIIILIIIKLCFIIIVVIVVVAPLTSSSASLATARSQHFFSWFESHDERTARSAVVER